MKLAVLVVVLGMLAGCSLPPETSATSPTPHAGKSANPEALAAREAIKPDPYWDFGQTVQITGQGFLPADLVAECCKPLVFENLTTSPVTVAFDHQLVNSGPIPPGGAFTYTPLNVESLVYHAQEHPEWPHGKIQVNQMFESLAGVRFTVS